MTAAGPRLTRARDALVLAPPPRPRRPSRWLRCRSWWWCLRGEIRFRVLAPVAQRVATRRQRERAWLAGFGWSLSECQEREPFFAGMLEEFGRGNEAGITASMPVWTARTSSRPRRPRRRDRVAAHLPPSRAEIARLDKRIDGVFAVMTEVLAADSRRASARPRARHLVAIDPAAWQDGDR